MDLIAIEDIEEGVRWTADGRTSHTATSVEAVMDVLDGPHVVICEPSFYDGLRDVRRMLGEILARGDHRLVPVGRGAQAALEVAAGDDDLGSGVCRLFSIVTAGSCRLDRLRPADENRWDVQAALDVVHAIDSFQASRPDFSLATEAMGPYAALSEAMKIALGDGLAYRADVLLAAYRAATVATSRKEFEQLIGMTSRSHSAMAHTLRTWYVERNTSDDFERDSVLGWSNYRRALRSVYHAIKEGRQGRSRAA